jgi:serine/threonine-protein kinase
MIHAGNGKAIPKAAMEVIALFLSGDKTKARESAERLRDFFEGKVRDFPNDADWRGQLGFLYVALGQKEDAIREGRKAMELLPESKDAYDGPAVTLGLAQIYAWTGETDQALALLEHSLNTPAGISVPMLKLDPIWDPLRKDPRFQALIDKYGAKS